jgi:Cu-Zn family superoxide dismutase
MTKNVWSLWLRAALGCASLMSVGCADMQDGENVQGAAPALSSEEGADYAHEQVSAELKDASGNSIGRATFTAHGDSTLVSISAQLAPDRAGIHGIHVHANDVADNGEGCIADPNADPSTHFVSADAHFNPSGEGHGHHAGDLPALFFSSNGEAWAKFTTDHLKPEQLRGRALILHASSDNYGNIPVGDGDEQYSPNSDAATQLTTKTGNAGARLGCGVIE